MRIVDPFIAELEMEAKSTKRVLERVPKDKLTWKPHAKAMSLGQLALHVATIPGVMTGLLALPQVEAPSFGERPSVNPGDNLVAMLDESLASARQVLNSMDDKSIMETWKVTKGDREIMSGPRVGFFRAIFLNHWYHHRGQLVTYIRQLDVPVPAVYGGSADESPFA